MMEAHTIFKCHAGFRYLHRGTERTATKQRIQLQRLPWVFYTNGGNKTFSFRTSPAHV
jgi:hypothetical protein